jgi:N6-L-threonylcarbamoyladenine synthase
VVPNLARREHQKSLVPLLLRALKEAKLLNSKIKSKNSKPQLKTQKKLETILEREPDLLKQFKKSILPLEPPAIDVVAVTHGPGLAPALWVGVNFARALAMLWDKPLIPVNHMEGHLYSALLQKSGVENFQFTIFNLQFPALALLVSGGHTELVLVKGFGKYKIIGETLDDAAGEAFDKVARMLGLGYPGGPIISAEAEKESGILNLESGKKKTKNIPRAKFQIPNSKFNIKLPRPMLYSKDYNFSFSGLKTAVLYLVRDIKNPNEIKKLRPLIAKEFQNAVVDVLVAKTIRAAKEYKVKTILLGGGVAANKHLQNELIKAITKYIPNSKFYIPDSSLTGDNALMIALAAWLSENKKAPNKVGAEPNLRLD